MKIRALTPILLTDGRHEIGDEFDAGDLAERLLSRGYAEVCEDPESENKDEAVEEVVKDETVPEPLVDDNGDAFDPEKHQVDKAGEPIINKGDGLFRKRR